jgi:hypothetical protein
MLSGEPVTAVLLTVALFLEAAVSSFSSSSVQLRHAVKSQKVGTQIKRSNRG